MATRAEDKAQLYREVLTEYDDSSNAPNRNYRTYMN
jgi:hypothetical protein